MSEEIVNKIAASALSQLDLEDYFPKEGVAVFDLKPFLFMELILKEKEFRESLQQQDWTIFENKVVAVTCSADAIIPAWAYMLVASYLNPIAAEVIFGDEKTALNNLFLKNIQNIEASQFTDKRVVVKGCGDIPIGADAYMEITKKLRPVVKSIMYGEPCSTVPIFKKK